jgi:hypothetical protein
MSVHLNQVNRTIHRKGTTTNKLVVITPSALDLDSPSQSPPLIRTEYSTLSYIGNYKKHKMDGTLIKEGDKKMFLDPTNLVVVPTTDDVINDGTKDWTIKDVITYHDKDSVCLYILQLRQ